MIVCIAGDCAISARGSRRGLQRCRNDIGHQCFIFAACLGFRRRICIKPCPLCLSPIGGCILCLCRRIRFGRMILPRLCCGQRSDHSSHIRINIFGKRRRNRRLRGLRYTGIARLCGLLLDPGARTGPRITPLRRQSLFARRVLATTSSLTLTGLLSLVAPISSSLGSNLRSRCFGREQLLEKPEFSWSVHELDHANF